MSNLDKNSIYLIELKDKENEIIQKYVYNLGEIVPGKLALKDINAELSSFPGNGNFLILEKEITVIRKIEKKDISKERKIKKIDFAMALLS